MNGRSTLGDGRQRERADGGARDGIAISRESGELPAHTAIRGVASVTNTDLIEMRPLYDAIDLDVLNRVFEPKGWPGSLVFERAHFVSI